MLNCPASVCSHIREFISYPDYISDLKRILQDTNGVTFFICGDKAVYECADKLSYYFGVPYEDIGFRKVPDINKEVSENDLVKIVVIHKNFDQLNMYELGYMQILLETSLICGEAYVEIVKCRWGFRKKIYKL